jgi:hypothetical protein
LDAKAQEKATAARERLLEVKEDRVMFLRETLCG